MTIRSRRPDTFPDGLFDNLAKSATAPIKAAASLGVLSAAACLEEAVVGTDELIFVRSRMTDIVARAGFFANPGGVVLVAEGGGGKSFICDEILKLFPREESDTHLSAPALLIRFEKALTPNQLARELLGDLDHALQLLKDKDEELTKTVVNAFQDCGVRLLIFDEAQHLLPVSNYKRSQARLLGATGDWIKAIADRCRLGCLWAGTLPLLEAFRADSQYSTRWSTEVELKPFVYDAKYVRFVKTLLEALPFTKESSCIEKRASVARLLCEVTRGNLRDIVTLLEEAATRAMVRRSKSLDLCDLSEAFKNKYGLVANPFESPGKP